MARPAPSARLTYAEDRAAEVVSEARHEYLNGEVWAAKAAHYRRIHSLRRRRDRVTGTR